MLSDDTTINTYLVDLLRDRMRDDKDFYLSSTDPKTRIRVLFGRPYEPEKVDWGEVLPRCRAELWEGLPVIQSITHFPDGTLDECVRMRYDMPFDARVVAALDARCRDFGFRLVFLLGDSNNHEMICPSETDAILLQSFMVVEIQDRILAETGY